MVMETLLMTRTTYFSHDVYSIKLIMQVNCVMYSVLGLAFSCDLSQGLKVMNHWHDLVLPDG